MRVINIVVLLIAQLAVFSHALPTPSTLSIRQEGDSQASLLYDYTLHRRAGHIAKEPLLEDQVYTKDAHKELANAHLSNAGKEFKGGFSGAGKSVTYGASQGYLHSKAAYNSFRSGQFRQGFSHTGKAIVKPIAGVGLSTVPLYQGMRYGMKNSGAALSQRYKAFRAPSGDISTKSKSYLANEAYMIKNQTPGRDYSQATVRENLRFKTQNYANGIKKGNDNTPPITTTPTPFVPNAQQQRNQDLPWSSTSGSPQYASVQSQHLGGVAPVTLGQQQYQRGKDLPWTATINGKPVESQLQ